MKQTQALLPIGMLTSYAYDIAYQQHAQVVFVRSRGTYLGRTVTKSDDVDFSD